MGNNWKLVSLGEPTKSGIYEVKLRHKTDLLDPDIETALWYRDGVWYLDKCYYNYKVFSWR